MIRLPHNCRSRSKAHPSPRAIFGSHRRRIQQPCRCRFQSSWCELRGRLQHSTASFGCSCSTTHGTSWILRQALSRISVADLLRLFRKFGRTDLGTRGKVRVGKTDEDTEAAALWDSVRRLVKTTVEWEDEEYQGISALVSEALLSKRYRETGKIYYAFGKGLSSKFSRRAPSRGCAAMSCWRCEANTR